jgi:hypothetical protein
MKRILALSIFVFLLQFRVNAQCDSIYVTSIEIPQTDSLNIIVSINNTSSSNYIYLNIVLTDDLTGQVIAESTGGYLQLYPNQINVFEIDTTIIFGQWELYYDLDDIPSFGDISVSIPILCDSIPWEGSLSITESDDFSSVVLYPNPTTDYLFINGKENVSFTLLNSVGVVVIKGTTKEEGIDIKSLPNGIYFFKIDNDSNAYKFIKK